MRDEKYHGQNKQNVNEKTRHVEGDEGQYPDDHEKHREPEQDETHLAPRSSPFVNRILARFIGSDGRSNRQLTAILRVPQPAYLP